MDKTPLAMKQETLCHHLFCDSGEAQDVNFPCSDDKSELAGMPHAPAMHDQA